MNHNINIQEAAIIILNLDKEDSIAIENVIDRIIKSKDEKIVKNFDKNNTQEKSV